MTFLTKQLAQEMVDRTMKIIGRNINVMDEKGVIIGSGEPERIDTIHGGAVLALERNTGFEVSAEDALRLHGVKPGINLPIHFKGKMIGVIGITGVPDEIRSYGELVRMAAELSLEQAVLVSELQWDERLKEEIVSQMIHSNEGHQPLFFERAARLGIDLDVPRAAVLIRNKDRQKTLTFMKKKLHEQDLSFIHPEYVVILKQVKSNGVLVNREELRRTANRWVEGLQTQHQLSSRISIGGNEPGLDGLAQSYNQAVSAMKAGTKLSSEQTTYDYEDLQLPILLLSAPEHLQGLKPLYGALLKEDKKGELVETLQAYIEHDGDINSVVQALFIHRNTLRYRLDRIASITGKDPRKMTELLPLYLSMLHHILQ